MPKQRILSGVKPTGTPHLGNYLGMIKPALQLSQQSESFFFIADYHALTALEEPLHLKEYTYDLVATFATAGMNFSRNCFYRQSDIPLVTELNWILSCVTPVGLLERGHAFKDKKQKSIEVNHGVFAYPVLMAADILLYDATTVPVGKDQKQHLEIARDLAQRFNNRFEDVLVVPEALIQEETAIIAGIDGRKMSKSYNNEIPLFCEPRTLRKRIMQIKTDSLTVKDQKDPEQCNVFNLFKCFATPSEIEYWRKRYKQGGMGYGEIKQATFEVVYRELGDKYDDYRRIRSDSDKMEQILADGAHKAKSVAEDVLARVRKSIGLAEYPTTSR